MENGSATQGKPRLVLLWLGSIKALPGECWAKLGDLKGFPGKFKAKVVDVAESIKNFGHDDPRQVIIHSLKVALALTLVSLICYVSPLYDYFGDSGMLVVIALLGLFEFTVGETLSKCLNSGFGTLLGGALGVGAAHLASLSGEKGEPILLGIFVFLIAVSSTFLRSFPQIKTSCDYGVMTFMVTFIFVSISGYRVENILQLFAIQRLLTIIIGGGICLIFVFVRPRWAGEELHNSVAHNIEKLAIYLEGFGGEDFQVSRDGCKSVIDSETTETNWANFASWEPGHGRFQFRHPWEQYLKIGYHTRQCVYQIEALNDCINSEIQAQQGFQIEIPEICTKISSESSKALKALSSSIKTMTHPSSDSPQMENSKKATEDLKDLLANTSTATIALILIDIVRCVEKIAESVHELSRLTHFKGVELNEVTLEKPVDLCCEEKLKPILDAVELNEILKKEELLHQESVKGVLDGDSPHVVIPAHETNWISSGPQHQ